MKFFIDFWASASYDPAHCCPNHGTRQTLVFQAAGAVLTNEMQIVVFVVLSHGFLAGVPIGLEGLTLEAFELAFVEAGQYIGYFFNSLFLRGETSFNL
jgi:hypothetical protein